MYALPVYTQGARKAEKLLLNNLTLMLTILGPGVGGSIAEAVFIFRRNSTIWIALMCHCRLTLHIRLLPGQSRGLQGHRNDSHWKTRIVSGVIKTTGMQDMFEGISNGTMFETWH
jgi:hypothetical protein